MVSSRAPGAAPGRGAMRVDGVNAGCEFTIGGSLESRGAACPSVLALLRAAVRRVKVAGAAPCAPEPDPYLIIVKIPVRRGKGTS